MKAYRVITGRKENIYGQVIGDEAEYFFDKEKALAKYAEGKCEEVKTEIITTYANGTTCRGLANEDAYAEYLAKAAPNEQVNLVTVEENIYKFEEIEIN